MRSSVLRLAGTLAVCVLAVSLAGCGSNNAGKIVGKWRVVSSTAKGADMEKMKSTGITIGMDFRADGTYSLEMMPADDSPETKKKAEIFLALAQAGNKPTTGKYTLALGDRVTMTSVKDGAGGKEEGVNVTINGDNMTMKDASGEMQLTRVK